MLLVSLSKAIGGWEMNDYLLVTDWERGWGEAGSKRKHAIHRLDSQAGTMQSIDIAMVCISP